MGRLRWIETLEGWQYGRYRIELAAPQLWVLSRRRRGDEGPLPEWKLIRTGGSLRELKRTAIALERQRQRRLSVTLHAATTMALLALVVVSAVLGWPLTLPASVATFIVGLRTLVIWVDGATGSAWSVLSDHYQ